MVKYKLGECWAIYTKLRHFPYYRISQSHPYGNISCFFGLHIPGTAEPVVGYCSVEHSLRSTGVLK